MNSRDLFDNPHVVETPDGEILPDPGVVAPMNPHKAKGELINGHQGMFFGDTNKVAYTPEQVFAKYNGTRDVTAAEINASEIAASGIALKAMHAQKRI